MNVSKFLLSLVFQLFFTSTLILAQENAIVKDFNKDRSFDFLVSQMAWEDVDLWDYVLTDGKTGKRWGYTRSIGYFGAASFITVGKTRNELPDDWDPYIEAIEDTLLTVLEEPDPSLQWVLDSRTLEIEDDASDIFDRGVRFEKKWHTGMPIVPANYTYRLSEEEAVFFENSLPFETYYWNYRCHNHLEGGKSEESKVEVEEDGIYKMKHALIEINEGQYAWLFMSGVVHTGGPSKLRWNSMKKVEQADDLVFLQQGIVVGEYAFWVGDLKKGIWLHLSNSLYEERQDFKLENERLVILDGEGGAILSLSFNEIEDELKKY